MRMAPLTWMEGYDRYGRSAWATGMSSDESEVDEATGLITYRVRRRLWRAKVCRNRLIVIDKRSQIAQWLGAPVWKPTKAAGERPKGDGQHTYSEGRLRQEFLLEGLA